MDISPRCPKCNTIVTPAYSIQYPGGAKTVSYECNRCGHAWQSADSTKAKTPFVSHDPPLKS